MIIPPPATRRWRRSGLKAASSLTLSALPDAVRQNRAVLEHAKSLGLPPLPVHEDLTAARQPLRFRQGRTLTQFHGFYDHGRALPTLAAADPEPALWISPDDALERGVKDGDAIRVYNQRGEMHARARVTDDVPPGTVWMRDGWLGLNTLTDGTAVIPDEAVDIFGFSGGQASFDAAVEVAPA